MNKQQAGRKRYPSELKERAVRMVHELQHADPNDKSVISRGHDNSAWARITAHLGESRRH
jgi:transposase-like protein